MFSLENSIFNVKLSYFLKQVEPFLVEVKIPHEIIENVASTFHA